MLLIHGLAATNRYWSGHFDSMYPGGQVIAVDLAGFGEADRAGRFDLDEQVESLTSLVDDAGLSSLHVVAHSYGALVALRLAAQAPTVVRSMVLFGPALYRDRATAAHRIGRSGGMARLGLVSGPLARLACAVVCHLPGMAGSLAERLRPDLPGPIARDGVAHSWPGYSGALAVTLTANGPALLRATTIPVDIVVGDGDRVVDRAWLSSRGDDRVAIEVWPGDHHLPVRDPMAAADFITAVCAR